MTHRLKLTAAMIAVSSLSVPAFAHVGDHSHAVASHWLVDHGLILGGVAAIIAIGATAYILKTKN